MERRLLLVFALTFLVIMLFQPLLKKYGPQPPATPPISQAQQGSSPAQAPAGPATTATAVPAAAPAVTSRGAGSASAPTQATAESETVIENGFYRIVFTNRGAQVKSWLLKKWDDDKGNPLELVNQAASAKYGYPLSLWTYDETLRNKLNSALYVATFVQSSNRPGLPDYITSPLPTFGPAAGQVLNAPANVTFKYSDGEIAVEKKFTFDHSYVVGVETSVVQKGAQLAALPTWPSGFGDQTTAPQYASSQIAFQNGSKVERLANGWTLFPSIKAMGGETIPGPFQWAGVSEQYFAVVFLPKDPQNAALVTLRNPLEVPHAPGDPNNKQQDKVDVYGTAVGSLKGPTEARLYVGPKALPDLESVAVPGIVDAQPDLRAVVDFGWLGIIARPLFLWLKWTVKYVHNWGWGILLQTLVINLAILPLRLTQMKSMLKMQRVAPQIKAIQEKYKKYSIRDPRKAEMNTEISAIYQKERVNPVGGCLPMLLPLFLLWPYYRMLTVAIDLRHAHWVWIHDLSAPDPHYILPIAIVVTMFLMQRMTPQAGIDPAQQRMMNIMMPLMLGYISFNLPAGLGLYWAAGQLFGIAQQWMMNRTSLGREMREMMAKRARKKEK